MNTLSEIIERKKQSVESERQEALNRVKTIENYQEWYHNRTLELEKSLPEISKTFKELGLILNIEFLQTTCYDFNVTEKSSLVVSCSCEMFGKMKPIKFAGYTSSGAGKNQKKLDEKAKKIEEYIKNKTCIKSIDVNQYSLEIKNYNVSSSKTQLTPKVLVKFFF